MTWSQRPLPTHLSCSSSCFSLLSSYILLYPCLFTYTIYIILRLTSLKPICSSCIYIIYRYHSLPAYSCFIQIYHLSLYIYLYISIRFYTSLFFDLKHKTPSCYIHGVVSPLVISPNHALSWHTYVSCDRWYRRGGMESLHIHFMISRN